MASCSTSPAWISITNGSDKHKQSILLRRIIIQSYNTSSSSASFYTFLQQRMILHEYDLPSATSNWLKCQLRKQRQSATQKVSSIKEWTKPVSFPCRNGNLVVGLCPPVVSAATPVQVSGLWQIILRRPRSLVLRLNRFPCFELSN